MTKTRAELQVSEVAKVSGVSVRTLHHYDEIGLLIPRGRTASGYRLYDEDDLFRLQQILVGRELGLPLEEIRRLLDDPSFDRKAALLAQKRQLEERSAKTARMIAAVEVALARLDGRAVAHDDEKGERAMTTRSMFDGFDPAAYEAEAEARWGTTDAFRESKSRTKRYGASDWKAIRAEQDAIFVDAGRALAAGTDAASAEAMAIAERHRQSIDRWFYPCSFAMHRGLADLFENDPRYAANIDKHAGGGDLTTWFAAAIRANAQVGGIE